MSKHSILKEIYFPFHGHTKESQRDGIPSAKELVKKHQELGYGMVCPTDHGILGSQVELWKSCEGTTVKPAIGIEFYMIQDRFKDSKNKEQTNNLPFSDDKTYHLTCMVASEKGYENLLKLNYLSNLKPTDKVTVEGNIGTYFKKPRITDNLIFKFQEGLIFTSGCRLSLFNQHLMHNNIDEAKLLLHQFKRNIDNFFIELHIAKNEVEENLFHWLKIFAFQNNLPCLIANDYHYLDKGDLTTWNILGSIRRNLTVSTADPIKNDDFYVKPVEEVYERVKELTNSVEETNKIFNGFETLRNLVTFEWKNKKLPKIKEDKAEEKLMKILSQRLINMFGGRENIPPAYSKRLREEYEVAKITDNCSYYLLVYDLIEYCKNNNIFTPIGRGSAGSLLMLYVLGITKIDPIPFNLVAERASNAQRLKEMDIDLDFSSEDIPKVIAYIKNRFGNDCVTNIVNYGVNKMSASLRHIFKYFEVPQMQKDKIAKEIKEKFIEFRYSGDNVEEVEPTINSLENTPEFQQIFVRNGVSEYKKYLKLAKGIEGTINNYSVHASGILISNRPSFEQIPVIRVNDVLCSAFDMASLNDVGALKLDCLTVSTYSKITESVNLFNKHLQLKKQNA